MPHHICDDICDTTWHATCHAAYDAAHDAGRDDAAPPDRTTGPTSEGLPWVR